MSTGANKVKCLNCGAAINHHADKILFAVDTPVEQANTDGILQELHSCPACGGAATRSDATVGVPDGI
jgi:hypothetical protein